MPAWLVTVYVAVKITKQKGVALSNFKMDARCHKLLLFSMRFCRLPVFLEQDFCYIFCNFAVMSHVAFSSLTNTSLNLVLLPEKFLQFGWMRAEVFQLKMKYLHVKISYCDKQNQEITSSCKLGKNRRTISGF